jgi:hypothetical protein
MQMLLSWTRDVHTLMPAQAVAVQLNPVHVIVWGMI